MYQNINIDRPNPTNECLQEDLCSDDELEDIPISAEVETRAHIDTGRHFDGKMDVLCPNCKALHWMNDKLTNSSVKNPLFGKCCLQGKIKLPLLITPPPPLKALYDGNNDQSKLFRRHT